MTFRKFLFAEVLYRANEILGLTGFWQLDALTILFFFKFSHGRIQEKLRYKTGNNGKPTIFRFSLESGRDGLITFFFRRRRGTCTVTPNQTEWNPRASKSNVYASRVSGKKTI